MKRKRKVGLPRVTLMAYSRRDLLAFVESVEALRHLVDDLRAVAVDLSNAAVGVQQRGRRRTSSAATRPVAIRSAATVAAKLQSNDATVSDDASSNGPAERKGGVR